MNHRSIRHRIRFRSQDLYLQHLDSNSPELDSQLIASLCDRFRFIFSNPPYSQFLFYPSDGRSVSPQEIFNTSELVSLEALDNYDLSKGPTHPNTQEPPLRWIDRTATITSFTKKLSSHGFLSVITDQDKAIMGATFGYRTTLREAFCNEEWQNPYHYSGRAHPQEFRSQDNFINQVQSNAALFFLNGQATKESPVFCHNCIFIHPSLQGAGFGYQLEESFLRQLPPEMVSLPCISEVVVGSKIAEKAKSYGRAISIPSILSPHEAPGNRTIIISSLQQYQHGLQEYLRASQLFSIA